jgi:hypothetical protein
VLLLAGILYGPGPDRVDGLVEAILERLFEVDDMAPEGHPRGESDLAAQARCLGLLGAMLRDLSPFGYQPADKRYERLKSNVLAIFEPAGAARVPLEIRVSAAEALGRAGDPRQGVGLIEGQHRIPDMLWCDIPAGTLQMGSLPARKEPERRIRPRRQTVARPGRRVPHRRLPSHLRPIPPVRRRRRVHQSGRIGPEAGWEWKNPRTETFKPYFGTIPAGTSTIIRWSGSVGTRRWPGAAGTRLGCGNWAGWTRPARSGCRPKPSGNGPPAVRTGTNIPGAKLGGKMPATTKPQVVEHTTAVGLFPAGAARWFAPRGPSATIWRATSGSGAAPNGANRTPSPRTRQSRATAGACCAVDLFGTLKPRPLRFPLQGRSEAQGPPQGFSLRPVTLPGF